MEEADSKISGNSAIILVFQFIICYAIVMLLSISKFSFPQLSAFLPLPNIFDSPMYLLLPAIGFFVGFFATEFSKKKYPKIASYLPIIIFVLGLFVWFLVMHWYYFSIAAPERRQAVVVFGQDAYNQLVAELQQKGELGKKVPVEFFGSLKNSAYYLFLIEAVLGSAMYLLLGLVRKHKLI
ncbi:MAG: hypothetical protein J7L14_02025 [Candidatus Diapherotrites archaeon]|nr:hypothetical protein [Candidatus Diapherotrites archaeon]